MYHFQNEPMYLHFYPVSFTQYFSITHLCSFDLFFFYTQENTHILIWLFRFSLYFNKKKKMKKLFEVMIFIEKIFSVGSGILKKPTQLDKQWRLWFWWAQWTHTTGVSGCCKASKVTSLWMKGAKKLALKLQGQGAVGFCLVMGSLTNLSKAIYIFWTFTETRILT